MCVDVLPTEDYVLFADRCKSLSNLNKRMLLVSPIVVLFFALSCYARGFTIPVRSKKPPYLVRHIQVQFGPVASGVFTGLPWFLVAEFALLYWVQARSFLKQAKPIVILSPEGISVDTQGTHLGLVYWHEIEEVRAYNLIYRYVGIVPEDSKVLSQRIAGSSARLFRLNVACISLYKLFGIFVAPINIPQVYLPVSADELLAHIQTYQMAYRHEGSQFHPGIGLPPAEGVWPPPPQTKDISS